MTGSVASAPDRSSSVGMGPCQRRVRRVQKPVSIQALAGELFSACVAPIVQSMFGPLSCLLPGRNTPMTRATTAFEMNV